MTMLGAYVEQAPPAGVRDTVACLWRQRVEVDRQVIVPDGCVDVVWFDSGRLVVAGADTAARVERLSPGETVHGVRLRPGAAAAALGRDVSELLDRQVEPAEVWGEHGADVAVALAVAGGDAVHGLMLGRLVGVRPDPVVQHAAGLLAEPGARVGEVARTIGVSDRQLQRRCVATVGYGPKMLARVLRLQRLRSLGVGDDDLDLADRALRAGYASQAHMGDEVRRLTGTTPVRFLEDRAAVA